MINHNQLNELILCTIKKHRNLWLYNLFRFLIHVPQVRFLPGAPDLSHSHHRLLDMKKLRFVLCHAIQSSNSLIIGTMEDLVSTGPGRKSQLIYARIAGEIKAASRIHQHASGS